MTVQPSDAYELVRKIRYDLTAAQAKITDLFGILNALDLPDRPAIECGHCGLTFRSDRRLAEHLYTSHNGPEPDHWLDIEARSVAPPTDDHE